jgi:hypothetical protein
MPPVANPPSKTPLLRLLKQARAYGLGVVLTTQNPVDLDYKGLTNTGTWFIGKLQTERDKNRVLEGLKSATQVNEELTEKDYGDIIGALSSRVFLLHNVHDDVPKVFHTRWAMNYLRGPLTGVQIKKLMTGKKEVKHVKQKITSSIYTNAPPNIDPKIEQYYIERSLDIRFSPRVGSASELGKIQLVPTLLLNYSVRFFDKKRGIDKTEKQWALAPDPNNLGEVDWSRIETIDSRIIHDKPLYSSENLMYHPVPTQYNTKKELSSYRKKLADYLYRNKSYPNGAHKDLKLTQEQNESMTDFFVRVKQAARERRDKEIDKLEKKYDSKLDRIESKISKITSSIVADEAEHDARKREEIFGIGETVLGVFLGRRRSTGITTASRRRRMTTRAKYKIADNKKVLEELKLEFIELEEELKEQVEEITEKWSKADENIEKYLVTPRRTDIHVNELRIAWVLDK